MKLSIITINLNNLDGLRKTVGSVLSQNWKEFEYIVIDGASTDGSALYLSEISKDLTHLISEKDRGIYDAMNKGVDLATGDYLLFLNSGDYLAGSQVLGNAHGELNDEDIVYGNLILEQRDGILETKRYPDQLSFSYVWEQSLPHPASFIRRDLFKSLGKYNEQARITADWQFFMAALFQFDASYRHIDQEITVFNLNGICNNPVNLPRIRREKAAFFRMKILLVAMVDSIHTARWISQLSDYGIRLSVFPAYPNKGFHPDIPARVRRAGSIRISPLIDQILTEVYRKLFPDYYSRRLARHIRRFSPDVIHSLETQGAGYLVSTALKRSSNRVSLPKWWHSNWGSDIFLFGRLDAHRQRIREVMERCDYYSCEGQRDVSLAGEFGFKGLALPVYPSGGGLKLALLEQLRKTTLAPSRRKVIMLKGYQGWAGRALTGIRSLERCADVLQGYTVLIYCNSDAPDVRIAAELFSQSAGIKVTRLPVNTPNEEILTCHGQARISIGLSISDAISTSLLEAMAMGSFPIQSDTSCATEWITDGVSGFIVPPEDPELIEKAIRNALGDDRLVDEAAIMNYAKIRQDADFDTLRDLTIRSCFKIYRESRL